MHDGGAEVPRPAIRICLDVGERGVRGAASSGRRRLVGDGAHQRVAKRDGVADDRDQAVVFCRFEGGGVELASSEGGDHPVDPPATLGCSDQQGLSRGLGKFVDPTPECEHGLRRYVDRSHDRGLTGELLRRHPVAQLLQRERISAGEPDQRFHHPCRQLAVGVAVEQHLRVGRRQRPDLECGECRECRRHLLVASGADECHAELRGPAGDVHQHLSRGGIDPLQVVGDHEDARVGGQGPQQSRRRDLDRDRIDRRRHLDPQRVAQRLRLRSRDTVESVEHWVQQIAERGVWQVGLPLMTAGVQRRGVGRRDHFVEQSRLADARGTADDHASTDPVTRLCNQVQERRTFPVAAQDHAESVSDLVTPGNSPVSARSMTPQVTPPRSIPTVDVEGAASAAESFGRTCEPWSGVDGDTGGGFDRFRVRFRR